jgi:hypothetical protein
MRILLRWQSIKLAVSIIGELVMRVFEFEELMLLSRVTSQYLWPYVEDVTRFDFEVDEKDEDSFERSFGLSR